MAADATKSSGSADSYIGSFISLTSKSEIRYEGFLFHINSHESTIGLRNVKSFGTEGRKKDGPQVLPSDKVYDYIYFRGSDIKDLQVISSPPVQSTAAVPNDPAIIQSHYPHPTSSSTSLPSAGAAPVTNLSSNAQSGLPASNYQGSLPLYQPVGNLGSWGSAPPPPPANGNGLAMPVYFPGFSGSSGGVSHLQQQSLLQPPQGLAESPPVQQQMQYPSMNASLPGVTSNFTEFSRSLLPTVGTGSPSLTSTLPPPSALPSNLPSGWSTMLASNLSSNLMPDNVPNADTTVTLGSSLPLVSPLTTSSLDVNPVVPPIAEKTKSVLGLTLSYQTISQSMPFIVGSSSAIHSEASIPSLVTPGQFLQPGSTTSSSHSLQTAHKDIEVVQASTSESLSSDRKNAQEPAQQLPSPYAKKLNGGSLPSYHSNRPHAQGRGNGLKGAALHNHHSNRDHAQGRGHARGRGHELNGATLDTHHNYRGHARGRGNGLNGAALHPHHSNRGHYWGRENGPKGAALHTHRSGRGHGRGRGTQVSPTVTKFNEDFDFEAMNEKFNKVEVWGRLGKSNKIRLEDKEGDENDSDGQDEDEDVLPKFDMKPVYVKDDFFDSLSCNTLNREPGSGRGRLSEQMRIDTETFGEFQKYRHGGGSQGPGLGGWSRGSYHGRGYGYAGRGRGRTFWSRVT